MERLLLYIGRLILVTIGFLAAALAASAAMHLFILPRLGFSDDAVGALVTAAYAFSIPFVALFVGYYALLPAAVVIAIAELWSVRGWLYHALGGGAVGLVVAMMFRANGIEDLNFGTDVQVVPPGSSILDLNLLAVMIGAGMVGGIAYWLIAGSTSGSWKRAATSPAP